MTAIARRGEENGEKDGGEQEEGRGEEGARRRVRPFELIGVPAAHGKDVCAAMHPILILIPAAALTLLPGLWAGRLLKRRNAHVHEGLPKWHEGAWKSRFSGVILKNSLEGIFQGPHESARRLIDERGLRRVKVE